MLSAAADFGLILEEREEEEDDDDDDDEDDDGEPAAIEGGEGGEGDEGDELGLKAFLESAGAVDHLADLQAGGVRTVAELAAVGEAGLAGLGVTKMKLRKLIGKSLMVWEDQQAQKTEL